MRINESGHIINATNFVNKCLLLKEAGLNYNPSNEEIKLAVLEPLGAEVSKSIAAVSVANDNNVNAQASRKAQFIQSDDLARKAVNILKSSGADDQTVEHARFLFQKLKGTRIGDLPNAEAIRSEAAAKGLEPQIPNTVSVSQRSYDQRLARFRDLVSYLKSIAKYNPNEEDLKVASLVTFADAMETLNKQVLSTGDVISKARAKRNDLLYRKSDGAYWLSIKAIEYVKGTSGLKSELYKALVKHPMRNYGN